MPPDEVEKAKAKAKAKAVNFYTRPFLYWRDPLCFGGVAAYLLNRLIIKPWLLPLLAPSQVSHSVNALFHGHFNDFLLVPVILPLFLWGYRLLGLRRHDRSPGAVEIALHVAMWSIFFELYGPHVLHRSVGDPWDAASYALGGLCAWVLWNSVLYPEPRSGPGTSGTAKSAD